MAKPTLEERVAALEQQLAELKATLANGTQPKDWRGAIGMFAGDEIMKQIDEEARKIQEADRLKARRSRYKRAASLLEKWMADESGYDETIWPALEQELKDSAVRLGGGDESTP
jgi:hypothetical protein